MTATGMKATTRKATCQNWPQQKWSGTEGPEGLRQSEQTNWGSGQGVEALTRRILDRGERQEEGRLGKGRRAAVPSSALGRRQAQVSAVASGVSHGDEENPRDDQPRQDAIKKCGAQAGGLTGIGGVKGG